MNKILRWMFSGVVVIAGCGLPAHQSLEQINPMRSYHANLASVMQAARSFSLKEGFKIERFEQDYGRVMGFKRTFGRGLDQSAGNPENRLIIMDLRLNRASENETDLTASFTFGDGQSVATRDEERLLVECYNSLFDHLEKNLPR